MLGYIPIAGQSHLQGLKQLKYGGICRWHVYKKLENWAPYHQPIPNLPNPNEVPHEAESKQVCIWSYLREVPRFHGHQAGDRSQPRENLSSDRDGTPKDGNKVQRLIGWMVALNQFVPKLVKRLSPFSQSPEECEKFQMDRGVANGVWSVQIESWIPSTS